MERKEILRMAKHSREHDQLSRRGVDFWDSVIAIISTADDEEYQRGYDAGYRQRNSEENIAIAHLSGGDARAGMKDAYVGAREDLLDWKRRALDAEHKLIIALEAVNEAQGPTFMGEAVLKRCSIVTEHDVDRACDIYCDASPDAKEVCTYGMRIVIEHFFKRYIASTSDQAITGTSYETR